MEALYLLVILANAHYHARPHQIGPFQDKAACEQAWKTVSDVYPYKIHFCIPDRTK